MVGGSTLKISSGFGQVTGGGVSIRGAGSNMGVSGEIQVATEAAHGSGSVAIRTGFVPFSRFW